MDANLPRVMEGNQMAEEMAITIALLTMPRVEEEVEALAVFQGMGETERVRQTVVRWERGVGKYLWITGNGAEERTAVQMNMDVLKGKPFNLTRTEGVHFQQDASKLHTGVQAAWIFEKIQSSGTQSVEAISSPYHIRVIRTLLKEFVRTKTPWISIILGLVLVPPKGIIPESGATAWQSFPGEVQRSLDYQKAGYVATYEETKRYIDWFWEHSPFSPYCKR